MASTSRLHILLVEDDDTARRSLASVLERAGYAVDAVSDGEQAVALLNSPAGWPAFDVVLTDLLLGTLDGVAVLKSTRALRNPPEVILLTGFGTLQTAIEALRAGAFDYLLKPCRPDDLLRCIKGAAERRAARAEQTAH